MDKIVFCAATWNGTNLAPRINVGFWPTFPFGRFARSASMRRVSLASNILCFGAFCSMAIPAIAGSIGSPVSDSSVAPPFAAEEIFSDSVALTADPDAVPSQNEIFAHSNLADELCCSDATPIARSIRAISKTPSAEDDNAGKKEDADVAISAGVLNMVMPLGLALLGTVMLLAGLYRFRRRPSL